MQYMVVPFLSFATSWPDGLIAFVLSIPPLFASMFSPAFFCPERYFQTLNQSLMLGGRKFGPGIIPRRHRSLLYSLSRFMSFFLPSMPFGKVQFSPALVDVALDKP
jgi:hypothetical protein